MCDFNNLNEEDKLKYHLELTNCADSFGGQNFFLQLLEEIRATKPHPLTSRHSDFRFHLGTIKWNKVIFNDKINLLIKTRIDESKRGNFFPSKSDKSYKSVMNLVRTLKPIEFTIKPLHRETGSGFKIKAFNLISEDQTKLNPVFDAVFFCSIDTIKRILNHKIEK